MMTWKNRAACIDHPHVDWFAETVTNEMTDLCETCPVRSACLMSALDGTPDKELGIRAATNEQDRRDIRAGRKEPWDIWDAQKQRTLQLT